MFWTVFPSIIRSSRLYIQHQVYVIQVRWMVASGHEIFHLVPASNKSTNLYDIYLMLYVQSWTPDDGRKDRPNHVEWYSINWKIVHLVGFTVEIYNDARSRERQNWLLLHLITLTDTLTLGRTPLDEGSARRRDLYLTTHNIHKRQTYMLLEGFEPTIATN
jgi:hypothetical protein